MQFHWGKAKLFGDITVFNFSCFINLELENSKQLCIIRLYYKLDRLSYRFSFNPFCGQGTRSNCRPTSKSFEFRIYDIAIIINFDLNQQKNDDKKNISAPKGPLLSSLAYLPHVPLLHQSTNLSPIPSKLTPSSTSTCYQ